MRKTALALLGIAAIGVGCKHIGGKCDCCHDASNAELPMGNGSQPYAQVGNAYHGTVIPEKLAAPEKMPEKVADKNAEKLPVPEKIPQPIK